MRPLQHACRALLRVFGALTLSVALSVTGSGSAPEAVAAPTGWAPADCPVEVPATDAARVQCGTLTVPERRTGGDPARTLRLPVAIISSRSATKAADPLVFPTGGGPGNSSLGALGYFLFYAGWAGERDIILVEQRGDALAEPSLNCPELDTGHSIINGRMVAGDEAHRLWLQQLGECHARLVSAGVDLAAYTSAESAADLADLRVALGYDEWNLYGLSYGSRLALTTMRDHPEGLRAVILDGVLPPQVNRHEERPAGFVLAVKTLIATCAADAECGARYPGLERSLQDMLDRAKQEPITVTVKHPLDRYPVQMTISDSDLAGGLFDALYDADVVRALPFVIDQLAHGNTEVATPLAQQNLDNRDRGTEGLYRSVECAEEVPFNDEARRRAAFDADPLAQHLDRDEPLVAGCDIWDVPAMPAIENQAVTSEIPTLITSGGFDPVTPPNWGALAAQGLSRHYRYDFPRMAHGPVWQTWVDDCPASIAAQFLRDPSTEPDSSCIVATPPIDFLTTEDIYPTPAIYRINSDLLQDRDPIQLAVLAVTLMSLLCAIPYALITLMRRKGRAPKASVVAALLTSTLNLGFAGGLAAVMLNTDPLILAFGLPTAARPVLLLPFLAMAGAGVMMVAMTSAWTRGRGSPAHRVALTAVLMAALVFAGWLLSRGLLSL